MSAEALSNLLDFTNARPLAFNLHHHRAGITPWDRDEEFAMSFRESPDNNPDLEPLALRWHQMVGIASILCHNFHKCLDTPESISCGTLVADEVGLGKTFQAAGLIAFLSQAYQQQVTNGICLQFSVSPTSVCLAWIPLTHSIGDKPYLGKQDELPNAAHLVLVPAGLVDQWIHELKTVLQPRSFDILVYQPKAGVPNTFWDEGGLFQSLKHAKPNIIVVTAHSTLQRAKHSAALEIAKNCSLRIIMTATPIHTSPKDSGSMGRLCGIPYFFSQSAYESEKTFAGELRRAKADDAEEEGDGNVDSCIKEECLRLQSCFDGCILRRMVTSKDSVGNPLVPLPECKRIIVPLRLTKWEMGIILRHSEEVKDSVSAGNLGAGHLCKEFYLDHRLSVGYAMDRIEDELPTFNTLEEWEAKKSTKFDICARLCKYILSHDGVPLPHFLLDLLGLSYVYIDGQTTLRNCTKAVKLFTTDPNIRILIFSSVGSSGLNLSVAKYLILLDQPWSAQDTLQLIGCLHRYPQTEEVTCFSLLALDTAEMIISELAGQKAGMMDAFLKNDQEKDDNNLYRLLTGSSVCELVDDFEEGELEYGEAGNSKKMGVKGKGKPKKSKKREKKDLKKEHSREEKNDGDNSILNPDGMSISHLFQEGMNINTTSTPASIPGSMDVDKPDMRINTDTMEVDCI
ncbi:hypothetical protein M422DRAFT_251151, partial [Sphaerobolus stellatus SS14]